MHKSADTCHYRTHTNISLINVPPDQTKQRPHLVAWGLFFQYRNIKLIILYVRENKDMNI